MYHDIKTVEQDSFHVCSVNCAGFIELMYLLMLLSNKIASTDLNTCNNLENSPPLTYHLFSHKDRH